jgi:AcrR family transcriptional regulator
MARIGERRAPAAATTTEQQARRARILKVATRLGSKKELDRISAQEIAAEAGVALRTLYRYYPSKYHVFAAVLTDQVQRLRVATAAGDPVEAVADLMAGACGSMLANTHLAHATITSTQAVRAQSSAPSDHSMRDLILATAGVESATAEQLRLVRLVEQVTFGVLTWAVGGDLDPTQAVTDVRLACRRLLVDAW